ncbi:hypothetical protein C8Q75DRAFT_550659 [Abortiporus biennis]|nr:hypothetical protein C8Q75DRAFT_550659 [Abortiporus biennis]
MSTSFADSDISMTEEIDLPFTSPPQNSTYDNWSLPVIQGAAYVKPQPTLPPQDHLPQNPFLAFDVNPSPGQASSSSSPLFVQGSSRDHALDSTSAYVPNLDYKPPSKSRKRKAESNDTPSNPSSSKRRRCGGPTVSTHGPLYCLFKGCKSFDKIFPNLKERNRHMDTHFDHRFACPACKTTFSRPESVKRHLKELTGAECKELVGTPDSDSFAIRGPYWKDIPWRTSELHIPRESDPLYALAMFGQP